MANPDYRVRSRLSSAPRLAETSYPVFTSDEVRSITRTARRFGVKVAAHVNNEESLFTALHNRVSTIEHGIGPRFDDADMEKFLNTLAEHFATWSPTLATYETIGGDVWKVAQSLFKRAIQLNRQWAAEDPTVTGNQQIKIACGGDTGVFAHGRNSREMALMVQLGADPLDVLQWCTLGGWECVRGLQWEDKAGDKRLRELQDSLKNIDKKPLKREELGDNDVPFGVVDVGFAADIIALGGDAGDLEKDFADAVASENVKFVMKGGKVFKLGGVELSSF